MVSDPLFGELPFDSWPATVPVSVVVPDGVGNVNVKVAVKALNSVQLPVPAVTTAKLVITSGTPTVKVAFRPVLVMLILLADSVKATVDAKVTVSACAGATNKTPAPLTASADSARTIRIVMFVPYAPSPSEGCRRATI